VVEEDFFDWVIEVPGGADFVRTLARRLSRFTWGRVEHDVMKVLYESVISATTRHDLGEYYTPDWLAEVMVTTAVTDPLHQRVLDPACGSGTFVFHAVRAYLAAAAAAGQTDAEAMTGVTQHVYGMDVHPVAATFARITYLLALRRDRLTADDRPPLTIPVYLGDSVQWGQDQSLLTGDALTVHTGDGVMLFADQLSFPDRLVADAARFDGLVADLADAAARDHRPPAAGTLRAMFRRYTVDRADEAMIAGTYQVMRELHDTGRDHIWGYYVRNLARPVWLSRPANRVDVLVGNPPWLSYRYMPPAMKADFRAMSTARRFWAGAAVATHQDLSALFVARAVEQYLTEAGTFSFVTPLAVLTRKQFAGFRTGAWSPERHDIVTADLTGGWDLHAVKPSFFPRPRGRGHRNPQDHNHRRPDRSDRGHRNLGGHEGPPRRRLRRGRTEDHPNCHHRDHICRHEIALRGPLLPGRDPGPPIPRPRREGSRRSPRRRAGPDHRAVQPQHQREAAVEAATRPGLSPRSNASSSGRPWSGTPCCRSGCDHRPRRSSPGTAPPCNRPPDPNTKDSPTGGARPTPCGPPTGPRPAPCPCSNG